MRAMLRFDERPTIGMSRSRIEGRDILPVMKFAPEYVDLRPQRELRGRQGSPALADDGDQLRAPGDARGAGDRVRQGRARVARGARPRVAGRDSAGHLRRHLRRPLLLRRAPRGPGLRRRCRRTAAHGALAQRHRHDDVPDAAARAGPRPARRHVRAAPVAAGSRRPSPRHHPRAPHPHPARAAQHGRPLPARRHRTARARRRRGSRRRSRARTATRSAPARSPAPAFRSIAA